MKYLAIACLLVVLACGKSDSGGGSPEDTVKAFIEAMAAGDLEAAGKLVPDDRHREVLGELKDEWPNGAKVKSVTPAGEPVHGMRQWKVVLDVGGTELETAAMTMEHGGKHYATFAIRKR